MGTNHYLYRTPDLSPEDDAVCGLLDDKLTLETGEAVGTIHICKKSVGWAPLFQAQPGVFESVRELLELLDDPSGGWHVATEYGERLTGAEFRRRLDEWRSRPDQLTYRDMDGCGWYKDTDGYEFVRGNFC